MKWSRRSIIASHEDGDLAVGSLNMELNMADPCSSARDAVGGGWANPTGTAGGFLLLHIGTRSSTLVGPVVAAVGTDSSAWVGLDNIAAAAVAAAQMRRLCVGWKATSWTRRSPAGTRAAETYSSPMAICSTGAGFAKARSTGTGSVWMDSRWTGMWLLTQPAARQEEPSKQIQVCPRDPFDLVVLYYWQEDPAE
jgi:hypothetical protein